MICNSSGREQIGRTWPLLFRYELRFIQGRTCTLHTPNPYGGSSWRIYGLDAARSTVLIKHVFILLHKTTPKSPKPHVPRSALLLEASRWTDEP